MVVLKETGSAVRNVKSINIFIWLLMIFLGFLTVVCVRVSNELGRGDAEAAKFSIKVITATSLAVGIIFFIVTWVFGDDISYIFSNSSEVAKVVSSLSILLACSVLLNSVQAALGGVAIGVGWQAVVAYVNIDSYYVVGIPVGVVLAYVAHLGIQDIEKEKRRQENPEACNKFQLLLV